MIISHIDRTIFDDERLLRLADAGCVSSSTCSARRRPTTGSPTSTCRTTRCACRLIRALIDRGHLDRVVICHDICYRTRLASFGGHGYGHIFANVVPMMKQRGYSEDEIDAILVRNPRRLLTFV